MWVNEGFKVGCFNTLQSAKQEFTSALSHGERVVTDRECYNEISLLFSTISKLLKAIMARHKNVNIRIDTFCA